VLGAGSVWAYNNHQASGWHSTVKDRFDRGERALKDCSAEDPEKGDLETCPAAAEWWRLGEEGSAFRDEFEARADFALWFVWVPPLVLTLLFYGIRWALTGRVRPLWILRRTPESS